MQNIEIDIAVLKEQMTDTKSDMAEVKDTQKDILEELKTFNTTVKTGKYIVVTILLAAGAFGHKSWEWLAQILTGN